MAVVVVRVLSDLDEGPVSIWLTPNGVVCEGTTGVEPIGSDEEALCRIAVRRWLCNVTVT